MTLTQDLGVIVGTFTLLLFLIHLATYGYRRRSGSLVPDGQDERRPDYRQLQSSIADQEPREKPCAPVRWSGMGDLRAVSEFERRRELDMLAKYDARNFGGGRHVS